MRSRSFVFVCFSSIMLASVLGCASLGGSKVSIDWALEKNGGRVSVFSEEPDHPASTLINGITSSAGWDQGEGWQAPITMSSGGRRSRRDRRDEEVSNWVIVELSQPVTVSHVTIHTVDSEKYPAKDFGVKSLLVQYELETASKDMIWANAERYGKGVGEKDNIVRDNASGVINVRFEPVNTQRIRIIIYGTNDLKKSEDSQSREGVIRLTEIEVHGMGEHEARSELEMMFEE